MKPIVHNLPEDKSADKVYNNIYPDRPKTSGMVIPKSLGQTQDRPPTQLKTKQYRKKSLTKVEEYKKKFKKLVRVKKQREVWEKMQKDGEVIKKWYKNEPEV